MFTKLFTTTLSYRISDPMPLPRRVRFVTVKRNELSGLEAKRGEAKKGSDSYKNNPFSYRLRRVPKNR